MVGAGAVPGAEVYELMRAAIFTSLAGTRDMTRLPWRSMRNRPRYLGSDFQKIVYPADYGAFCEKAQLNGPESWPAGGNVLDLQVRGEYLYAAMGKGGVRVFDIANIDNKDISERMITAPVSPLGQTFYCQDKVCQAIAYPEHAWRRSGTNPVAGERRAVRSISCTDSSMWRTRYEGLVIVGNPDPNTKSAGRGYAARWRSQQTTSSSGRWPSIPTAH